MLFYNKSAPEPGRRAVPKTWSAVAERRQTAEEQGRLGLRSHSAAVDQWPTLMWFEYLYDRVAGPSLVTDALAGEKSVWDTAASKSALGYIKQLVNGGAFGPRQELGLGQVHRRPTAADDGQRASPPSS